MKKYAAFSALAFLVTTANASETWSVVEGPQGAQKGSWNVVIDGASVATQAKMAGAHGQPVTYNVTGKIEKGVYSLKRQAASDHIDCAYRGEVKSDGAIVGSAMCGGLQGPWIARPAVK